MARRQYLAITEVMMKMKKLILSFFVHLKKLMPLQMREILMKTKCNMNEVAGFVEMESDSLQDEFVSPDDTNSEPPSDPKNVSSLILYNKLVYQRGVKAVEVHVQLESLVTALVSQLENITPHFNC